MENPIETKTSEELALLLQQCHQQIRINEANINMILNEITARQQRHTTVEKELSNGG